MSAFQKSAEEGKVLAIWFTQNFALQSANDITGSVDAHNHRKGIILWEGNLETERSTNSDCPMK